MHWMGSIVYALVLIVAGMVLGGFLSLWGALRFLGNPEYARKILKSMYRRAHPHWLRRGGPGGPHVCPCCGWSETEGIGVPASTGTVADPHRRTHPMN